MDEEKRNEVYTKAHNLSMVAQESAVVSLLICISQQLEEQTQVLREFTGIFPPKAAPK